MSKRSDLHQLKLLDVKLATLQLKAAIIRVINVVKYSPDQPRVAAGGDGAGQWTSGGASGEAETGDGGISAGLLAIASRLRAICEKQYEQDVLHCRMSGLSSCYAQAMVRRVACERGFTIPPLNY